LDNYRAASPIANLNLAESHLARPKPITMEEVSEEGAAREERSS
jgi:hypothetical protein